MADFEYRYSAPEQEEIRKIREKYIPTEESKMEKLRRLDACVTRKGTIVSLAVGILCCLIMGTGMSCCLVWGGAWFVPGVIIGSVGIAGMGAAYPLYTAITAKERERLAPEILKLTEELMQ